MGLCEQEQYPDVNTSRLLSLAQHDHALLNYSTGGIL